VFRTSPRGRSVWSRWKWQERGIPDYSSVPVRRQIGNGEVDLVGASRRASKVSTWEELYGSFRGALGLAARSLARWQDEDAWCICAKTRYAMADARALNVLSRETTAQLVDHFTRFRIASARGNQPSESLALLWKVARRQRA